MAFCKKLMDALAGTMNLIEQIKILWQLSQFSGTQEVIVTLFSTSSCLINCS